MGLRRNSLGAAVRLERILGDDESKGKGLGGGHNSMSLGKSKKVSCKRILSNPHENYKQGWARLVGGLTSEGRPSVQQVRLA